jgi:hypothetical protein
VQILNSLDNFPILRGLGNQNIMNVSECTFKFLVPYLGSSLVKYDLFMRLLGALAQSMALILLLLLMCTTKV